MLPKVLAGLVVAAGGVVIDHPDIKTLIPNAKEAGFAALRSRGYYPINHMLVVKASLSRSNPLAVRETYRLLAESKKQKAWKRLCEIPSIGPIRAAVLLGILQTPTYPDIPATP